MVSNTRKIVMSAMFAALICVATMIIKIQITPNGYVNFGDGIVMLAGFLLGPLYGFLAAGIGSALADLFAGFVVYMPATFVVKGLMAVVAVWVAKGLLRVVNKTLAIILATVLSELVMVLGYYIFEGFIYGFDVALLSMPGNAVQAIAGIISGAIFIRMFLKRRF